MAGHSILSTACFMSIIAALVTNTESTRCRPETHNTCVSSRHVTARCVHLIGQDSGHCQCVPGYTPSPFGCAQDRTEPSVKLEFPDESSLVGEPGAAVRLRCLVPGNREPDWIAWRVGPGKSMVRSNSGGAFLNTTLGGVGTQQFSCMYQLYGSPSPESSTLLIDVEKEISAQRPLPGTSLTVEGMPGFVTGFPVSVPLRCAGQLLAARKRVMWFHNADLVAECHHGPCDFLLQMNVTAKTEGHVTCQVEYPLLGGFVQKSLPRSLPKLQGNFQAIHILEGDMLFYTDGDRPLILTCEHGTPNARFGGDVIITWYSNHMILPDQRSEVMRLSRVQRHHSGLYHCVANSSTSRSLVFSPPVSVIVDPVTKIRLSSEPEVPVKGGHVTLTCAMEFPTVVWNSFAIDSEVTWYLNGKLVQGHTDSKLQMDDLDFDVDMNFSCLVKSQGRKMESNSLLLKADVTFKDIRQPVLAFEDVNGDHVIDLFEYDMDYFMNCRGDKRFLTPGVEYQFLKDGVVFVTSKTPRVPLPKSLSSRLFACQMVFADNMSPRSQQHTIGFNGFKAVEVYYEGRAVKDLAVYQGQHVTFHCHTETYPGLDTAPLLFQWKVNGVLVSTQQNYTMEVSKDHVSVTCLAALDSQPFPYYVISVVFATRSLVMLVLFLAAVDLSLHLVQIVIARCRRREDDLVDNCKGHCGHKTDRVDICKGHCGHKTGGDVEMILG